MFQKFALHGDGRLDIIAFQNMIESLNIGLPEKRVKDLFLQFGADINEDIDAPEFMLHLFPKAFEVYMPFL